MASEALMFKMMYELDNRLQIAETQVEELRKRAENAEQELVNQTKDYLEHRDTLLRDCQLRLSIDRTKKFEQAAHEAN
jgi:hypothetical protein